MASDLLARLRHLDLPSRRTGLLLALSTPLCAYLITLLLRSRKGPTILRAPRPSLQNHKPSPYPSDAIPGARDIPTPHGSTRTYEFGPPAGRKLLFLHGISTPSPALYPLARLLADRHNCRCLLFDLHGRGYSDASDPRVVRQGMRLWGEQIGCVLRAIGWEGGVTVVGYSMGGGIGAAWAAGEGRGVVEGLVLIAPGGLLRHSRIAWSSKLLYSGLLPQKVVEFFVRRRLAGPAKPQPQPPAPPSEDEKNTPADAATAELPQTHPAHAPDSPASILPNDISIADTVAWQLTSHPGFLPSFISSIRHAPVSDEHETWRAIGRRCDDRRNGMELPGLKQNQVLILLGRDDGVIIADEIEQDAKDVLGKENVRVVRLEGGHDVPVVNAGGCCGEIVRFLGLDEEV